MSKKKQDVSIGIDERKNHTFYHAITNPVKEELTKRGFKVETYDNTDGSVKKKYDMIIFSYGTTRNKYNSNISVLMEHGISPLKNAPGFMASHFFCPGEAYKFMLETVDKLDGKFYLAGYPKLDWLINNKKNREKYRQELIKELNLDPTKPIVTYLPTFVSKNPDNQTKRGTTLELKKINFDKLIPNFVISVHGFDKGYRPVVEILNKAKHKYWEPNKEKLLLASDIIVGDISSVLMEALVLDIPIIHIHNDDFYSYSMYNHQKKEHGCYGLLQLGDFCSIENLPETVRKNIKHDDYKGLRKYWLERLLYKPDGQSTKRVADLVEQVLKEENVLNE